MSSEAFSTYVGCLEELRYYRRAADEDGNYSRLDEQEEPRLDAMDACWKEMSDEERENARKLSWRAWPDKYDAAMKDVKAGLVDQPVWGTGNPPRKAT